MGIKKLCFAILSLALSSSISYADDFEVQLVQEKVKTTPKRSQTPLIEENPDFEMEIDHERTQAQPKRTEVPKRNEIKVVEEEQNFEVQITQEKTAVQPKKIKTEVIEEQEFEVEAIPEDEKTDIWDNLAYLNTLWERVNPVISLRGGVDLAEVGETQHITIYQYDPNPNKFTVTDNWETKAVWSGFLGIEFLITPSGNYHWQTGIAYYQTDDFKVKGLVEPYSNPWIVDLNFDYTVNNQRIMFENKFIADLNQRFSLYLLGGIGAAINKASAFYETARDPLVIPDYAAYFADHTESSFSYSVGLGVEATIIGDLRASLGYQYSDLGEVSLGNMLSPNATSDTLSSDSTPTNEFLFGLTYVFD